MMAGQFCENTTVTNKRSKNSKCSRTCFPLAILHPYGFAQVHTLQTLMHRLMSIPPAAQHTGERPRGTPACAHTHTHTHILHAPCRPASPFATQAVLETVPLSHLPRGIYTQPPTPSNTQAFISTYAPISPTSSHPAASDRCLLR